jgi:hypothetical protein
MRSLTKEIEGEGRELPLGSRGERNHQNPFGSGQISGGNQGKKKGAAAAQCSIASSLFAWSTGWAMVECARPRPFSYQAVRRHGPGRHPAMCEAMDRGAKLALIGPTRPRQHEHEALDRGVVLPS